MNWAVWMYLAVAVPYTLFVVLYATRSRWWVSNIGRSLLLSKGVIALLSIHVVVSLAFPSYPGQEAVRLLVVGGAIVAGWWQLALLVKEQQRARRRKRNHTPKGFRV
jgi:hypothetical protein